MRRGTRLARLAPLLAGAALLPTACVSLPTDGPVVVSTGAADPRVGVPAPFDPAPPQPGETPQQVVTHFLDAMTAFPPSTQVARQFLADDAPAWDPSRRTIAYADKGVPTGSGELRVRLYDANWLDSRGRWRGMLPEDQQVLRFPIVFDGQEARIGRAPDALVVRESWLADHYRRVNLYFFDPTASVLVPEPVLLPVGDQFPTGLIAGLLRGPGESLAGVSRSFLPRSSASGLSVPVNTRGIADVSIPGEAGEITEATGNLILAQIAWTLRQEPSIRAFRLTVGGQPIGVNGRDVETPVDFGADVGPAGEPSSFPLFGLRDGSLVYGRIDSFDTLSSPFGQPGADLRSVAVDDRESLVAGVSSDGRSVSTTSVFGVDAPREQVASGSDFLPPAWDFSQHLWVVDRTPRGAQVVVIDGDRRQLLEVPGVSGMRVRQFLVARDGSRLVAVVVGRGRDSLVVSRIRRDEQGRVVGATRARRVAFAGAQDVRVIKDIGWRSSTTVAVLSALNQSTSQVRIVSLDGSPVGGSGPSQVTLGRTQWLVTSESEAEAPYAISGDTATVISELGERYQLTGVEPATLTYGG